MPLLKYGHDYHFVMYAEKGEINTDNLVDIDRANFSLSDFIERQGLVITPKESVTITTVREVDAVDPDEIDELDEINMH